jgi:hypothetical protein
MVFRLRESFAVKARLPSAQAEILPERGHTEAGRTASVAPLLRCTPELSRQCPAALA